MKRKLAVNHMYTDTGSRIILFATERNLNTLSQHQSWIVDGTFYVAPKLHSGKVGTHQPKIDHFKSKPIRLFFKVNIQAELMQKTKIKKNLPSLIGAQANISKNLTAKNFHL